MVYNEFTRFGEDSNGSALYFRASEIKAKKVPGTLKQVLKYRLVERQVPMRNILDWNMRITGAMFDTEANVTQFKIDMNNLYGDKYIYSDGDSEHAGSYVMKPYSLKFDEPADNEDGSGNMLITFSFDLLQYNQEP